MAAAISEGASGWLAKRVSPGSEVVEIVIYTANTVDDTDTIAIDLANYGGSTFLAILGNEHTTDGSVVVTAAPTTAVSGTTLTITVGGSNDNNPRTFIVWALSSTLTWTALV